MPWSLILDWFLYSGLSSFLLCFSPSRPLIPKCRKIKSPLWQLNWGRRGFSSGWILRQLMFFGTIFYNVCMRNYFHFSWHGRALTSYTCWRKGNYFHFPRRFFFLFMYTRTFVSNKVKQNQETNNQDIYKRKIRCMPFHIWCTTLVALLLGHINKKAFKLTWRKFQLSSLACPFLGLRFGLNSKVPKKIRH